MKPSELLIKAQAVIADPRRWTQDVYAKDAPKCLMAWKMASGA